MKDIKTYSRQGHLPNQISNIPIPICNSCQYDKTHKQPSGDTPLSDSNKPIYLVYLLHIDQDIYTTQGKCLLH